MSASTVIDDAAQPQEQSQRRFTLSWQFALFCLIALALLAFGLWMRLHNLNLPYDRDGYDEGVYWQSLRAMSSGYSLYQQIFYSQPPFFLLSIYPIFALFGHSLESARAGIAVVSLFGLVGAFFLGKALGGRIGAIAALLLIIADPFYLSQSQRIEAEAPCAAFALLAVGLAYMWWEHPEGINGIIWGALAGIALMLSILSKLFGLAAVVPLGLLMLAQLWRIFRQPRGQRFAYSRSLLAGILGFLLTGVVVLAPFLGAYDSFIQGVVTFHNDANTLFKETQQNNLQSMSGLLTSIPAYIALFSTIVALLRRDWRVLPLLAWLGATVYILNLQTPLFHHHLVMLIPPLVSLAVVGIAPIKLNTKLPSILQNIASAITLIAVLVAVYINYQGELLYYSASRVQSQTVIARKEQQAARDLQNATTSDQLVITDDQFAVGLADRNTPPSLVDTSLVRIDTKYVTVQQLIQAASQPNVHAVFFYTGRLRVASVNGFRQWMISSHLWHRLHNYGNGRELWVKM